MPFTIDEAAAQLDTAEVVWRGKPCKITEVPASTIAQIRANWPGPVPPKGQDGRPDFESPLYQARLMADGQEMGILELAAAIDLAPVVGYSVHMGASVATAKNPAPLALSAVLELPENEKGAATEAWCVGAMKSLGGLSAERLKPIQEAYDKLGAADVTAAARGN